MLITECARDRYVAAVDLGVIVGMSGFDTLFDTLWPEYVAPLSCGNGVY